MLREMKAKIGIPILVVLLWIGATWTTFAAGSFSVSGGGTVEPGSTVNITITLKDCVGKFSVNTGSATTMVDGDALYNETKSISTSVKAPSSGQMTVTVTAVNVYSTDESPVTGSKSVTIQVKEPVAPTPKPETQKPATTPETKPETPKAEEKPKEVEKSDDNRLSELTAGGFKLSPVFRQDTYEYSLGTITSKEVKIQAKASDAKAKVSGTGTKTLVLGENVFNITVMAENGKKQVYKISAKYEEPKQVITHKFNFKGKELTVPMGSTLSAPDGFEEVEIQLEGQKVPAWENKSAGIVIVNMQTEDKKEGWYRVEEELLSSSFQAMGLLGENLYLVDIGEEEQQRDGMQFGQLKVDKKTIPGWLFLDVNLENYYLIPALDAGGKQVVYLYEKTKNNMVLFTDAMAVSMENYQNMLDGNNELEGMGKEVEQLHADKIQYQIVIVAVAALAVFFLVCAIISYVFYIKKRNTLRRLMVKNRAVNHSNQNNKDYPRYTMEPIHSNKNKK